MRSRVRATTSGALAELSIDGLSLLQYPASELEAGPANLWLRLRGPDGVLSAAALTGPASGSSVVQGPNGPGVSGAVHGVSYRAWFDIADDGGTFGWRWRVKNTGEDAVRVDLLWTLDVALTPMEDVRKNENYVAQYLDLSPVEVDGATALAVRQNMPGTGAPWVALGSSSPSRAWGTDARQLRHLTRGAGLDPTRDLPSVRLQHEHTLASLQTDPIELAPLDTAEGRFWGVFVASHPRASGNHDEAIILERLAAAAWHEAPSGEAQDAVPTVFSPVSHAPVLGDTNESAGRDGLRLAERDPEGRLLSAFVEDRHVVTAAKERRVLRPHGVILHRQPGPIADSSGLAATVWMSGVFCAQLTAEHASEREVVSIRRSYLGLTEAAGVRILLRRGGGTWSLLTTPTRWEVADDVARWVYLLDGPLTGVRLIVESVLTSNRQMALRVHAEGPEIDALIVVGDAHGGAELTVEGGCLAGDGPLFADGVSRGLAFRSVLAECATEVILQLRVSSAPGPETQGRHTWAAPRLEGSGEAAAVSESLRWMVRDARVHFQMPRGLEQYTGGAWGTRDVCQGPTGLLLATGEFDALRHTLVTIFSAQQDDGSWPQAIEFLPGHIRPGRELAHGDVVYWPLLALGEYLIATGDVAILDSPAGWVGEFELLAAEPLRAHVERAVEYLMSQRTKDRRLPAYGHGDWNDSLQPAEPQMAASMCSTWTAELEVHALRTLAAGLETAWPKLAEELTVITARTEQALSEFIVDGELAGYAIIGESVETLVHPGDERTGLTHGLLHMIHAISGELFTPEQARAHAKLIRRHLVGPTGAYLFDSPVTYTGGPMTVFQRAESATFWGREIGLMYTHAHLRYVEALTRLGDGTSAWSELMKVVPIGLTDRVPGAAVRQANCYYSSSDAAFPDRYQATDRADDLFDDATTFEGGWRVYSSGPGLILRLMTQSILGVRQTAAGLEIDPVLPAALDGLKAMIPLPGRNVYVTFHVGPREHGVDRVRVGGRDVATQPLTARYRQGGVRLCLPVDAAQTNEPDLVIEVFLGGERVEDAAPDRP